jgi:AraC family transcriptional activator of mtrCDE
MLTDIRMTLAGHKLIESSLGVAEIGEMVGYQSNAAFQRIFKRMIGVTPSRYRTLGGKIEAAENGAEE